MNHRLEFRIPISPTPGFFSQVRFFDAALRRLGGVYEKALLTVTVGDKCDLPAVIAHNSWSEGKNVRWVRVPDEIFDRYSFYGTSDSRFLLEPEGDVIVFSDADTVLVRDVDPIFDLATAAQPAFAGHMAHRPPVVNSSAALPPAGSPEFWPNLFRRFALDLPEKSYPYSIPFDEGRRYPPAPAYLNYGFVAFNPAALGIFRDEIFPTLDQVNQALDTFMRCQISCTIVAHRHHMKFMPLSAEFNAANDAVHYFANWLTPERIRVIHYLRPHEVDRSKTFLPGHFERFLEAELKSKVNIVLQGVARSVRDAMRD